MSGRRERALSALRGSVASSAEGSSDGAAGDYVPLRVRQSCLLEVEFDRELDEYVGVALDRNDVDRVVWRSPGHRYESAVRRYLREWVGGRRN